MRPVWIVDHAIRFLGVLYNRQLPVSDLIQLHGANGKHCAHLHGADELVLRIHTRNGKKCAKHIADLLTT